jgi:hypothetical protein
MKGLREPTTDQSCRIAAHATFSKSISSEFVI